MNWRVGLQRVSVVFWGLLGVLVGLVFIFGIIEGMWRRGDGGLLAGFCALGLAICYAGHKISCWIVQGFTRD